MKITRRLLEKKGACQEQVDLFDKLFPRGIVPTKALCLKHAADFDWNWAAHNLLTTSAREAYQKATAPAWEAYHKAKAKAFYEGWKSL